MPAIIITSQITQPSSPAALLITGHALLPAADRHARARRGSRIGPHRPGLHRRHPAPVGMAEPGPDIAIVVSELMTNALRHAPPGPAIPGPGGRSGSACCSPGHGCCAQSPTRPRPLRYRERPAPSPRPAADCTSSARSATGGATARPARPERSCGPCSACGWHRRPRPGTRAGQAATGPGTW
jgi:hypothetical protein